MSKEAWGRWGPEDEVGAPNAIGPAELRAALACVRQHRVVPLAQSLSARTPTPGHRGGIAHFMGRDGGDYAAGARRPGGFQFSEDTIVLPVHSGTHIDALCHCWHGRLLYNGFPEETVRSGGAGRCGVDKLPPLAGRGVLLDFVSLTGRSLEDGETIGTELLQEAIAANGARIAPGDIVLLRTGWLETRGGEQPDFDAEPGLGVDAALLLAEAGIAALGADNFAVEVLPFPQGEVFPVHQRLIRDYGIPLIEGLVLAPLGETGARTFLFVAAPLPIVGGTGSPLAPLAVI